MLFGREGGPPTGPRGRGLGAEATVSPWGALKIAFLDICPVGTSGTWNDDIIKRRFTAASEWLPVLSSRNEKKRQQSFGVRKVPLFFINVLMSVWVELGTPCTVLAPLLPPQKRCLEALTPGNGAYEEIWSLQMSSRSDEVPLAQGGP